MDTQKINPSDPPPTKFTLEVQIQGCFIFSLKVDTTANAVVGINVYAPVSGHVYRAGIQGQWNNPYFPDTIPPSQNPQLFMLQPRRYCLELAPAVSRTLSLSALQSQIQNQNLWPETDRIPGIGWDMVVTLPIPEGAENWITEYMDVSGSFAGKAGQDLVYMGMSQTLVYKDVEGFVLRGSPLPVATPVPDANNTVSFMINGETPCIPSIEHQRSSAEMIAQIMGIDFRLDTPMQGMMGTTDTSGKLRNGQGSSCMGGGIIIEPSDPNI